MIDKLLILLLLAVPKNADAFNQEAESLHQKVRSNKESTIYQQYEQDAQDLKKIVTKKLNNPAAYKPFKGISNQQLISQDYDLSKMFPGQGLEDFKAAIEQQQDKQIDQLMIFISKSMPKNALIQYANQSAKSGGVLVLRGLIDNSLSKTTTFIYELNKKGTKAIIDPLSFRNFQVTSVPQIVVIANGHNCRMGRCYDTPLHDKVTGNVSLDFALRKIAKEGKYSQSKARQYLKQLNHQSQ